MTLLIANQRNLIVNLNKKAKFDLNKRAKHF